MRKFALINAKGVEWDLNDDDSFLSDPDGLGWETDYDYDQYGNCFVKTKDKIKQPSPKGKINFSGYEKYHEFMLFLQYPPIVVKYTAFKTYYMDTLVKKITKTEIAEGHILPANFELEGMTPWYEVITVKNEATTAAGKAYPYTYPYTYVDSDSGVAEINVESNEDSGVKLTVLGSVTNPSWSHAVNGIKVISGKITATIPAGHRMVVDSTGTTYMITERDANNLLYRDLYQKSDFSTARFITLKPGKNIIACAHEGTEKISMIVEAKVFYASI